MRHRDSAESSDSQSDTYLYQFLLIRGSYVARENVEIRLSKRGSLEVSIDQGMLHSQYVAYLKDRWVL